MQPQEGIDLLLIDSNVDYRTVLKVIAEHNGLHYNSFEWGYEALDYLLHLSKDQLPKAYIIDTGYPGNDGEDLAIRPQIFDFLREKERTEHLYFITNYQRGLNSAVPFPETYSTFYEQLKEKVIDKMETRKIFEIIENIAKLKE